MKTLGISRMDVIGYFSFNKFLFAKNIWGGEGGLEEKIFATYVANRYLSLNV